MGVRILLITLNYPQHQMSGPPFSVDKSEVESLFSMAFNYQELKCFEDIENVSKLVHAGVDYIENAAYCSAKSERIMAKKMTGIVAPVWYKGLWVYYW